MRLSDTLVRTESPVRQPRDVADWQTSLEALRDQMAFTRAELDATQLRLARGYHLLQTAHERIGATRSLLKPECEAAHPGQG